MKVIVCIRRISQEPQPGQFIINPLDRNALEEGLRIKERFSGKVIALSMDAPPARKALEEALVMGADEAVLLCDTSFAGADTLATAHTLACGIRRLGHFDLILCGNQSMAGATGQVGPELAEFLGIPHVTYVNKIDFIGQESLLVERSLEHGHMKVKLKLPSLLAVVKEINRPRLPTVWAIMEASEKRLELWSAADIGAQPDTTGLQGSPTCFIREFKKIYERRKEILEGSPEESVRRAIQKLRELGAI